MFDQSLKCNVAARALVRVRMVLDRKPAWRAPRGPLRDLMEAKGNSSRAAVSVRTVSGKPLAYFTLESGKTRPWTAGSCTH